MVEDHYRTLSGRVEFRHKIERSDFLGIAFPIVSEEGFFAELERVQKLHFDATHHCWAFRLFDSARSRSSDAGEPSGTAGKPILAAVEGAALHDVGAIVVRWYGGIKLGTGGLSRAYRETMAETLNAAIPLDRYVYERVEVFVPFEAMSGAWRLADAPNIVLTGQEYGEKNVFSFDVRASMRDSFLTKLRELRLEVR